MERERGRCALGRARASGDREDVPGSSDQACDVRVFGSRWVGEPLDGTAEPALQRLT